MSAGSPGRFHWGKGPLGMIMILIASTHQVIHIGTGDAPLHDYYSPWGY